MELESTREFFNRSTRNLSEDHSTFAPAPEMMTAAQQVAHVAQTIDWFMQGAFRPEGFLEMIGRKYDQLIQPYMFGEPENKATCLWIEGLPKLKETNNVKHIWQSLPKNEAQRLHYLPPSADRAKLRSKTYKGIAEAVAAQWAEYFRG